MLKPLEIPPLTVEEMEALEKLYRTTKDVRLRTRAQIVLLAGEQRMTAPAIAAIVREVDQTVRNWRVSLDGRRNRRTQRSAHARPSAENQCGVERAIAGRRPASASQLGTTLFDVDAAAPVRLHGGANGHAGLLRNGSPGAQSRGDCAESPAA
jgi:hypothetical protein